ncbi:hypothetical protein [Carnimonas nigrificans]|uniref:hypothetical protein n=1 Tax=Carnimonas nigrificans TaxID=64323 RepID=UPI00046FBA02|nr:hypothetical protein [Carnimonas nigrificans]
MSKSIRFMPLVIAGAALLFSTASSAAWKFDPDQSRVSATFIDQRSSGNVESVYHINRLAGTIDDEGHLNLPLELSQLDLLQQVPAWLTGMLGDPKATITGDIDPSWFNIDVGSSITRDVKLTVTSKHHSSSDTVPLKMTRSSENAYQIETAKALSLRTSDLLKQQYAQPILQTVGFQNLADHIPLDFEATVNEEK